MLKNHLAAFLFATCFAFFVCPVRADDPTEKPSEEPAEQPGFAPADELPNLTRLAKDQDVWYDAMRKLVVVDGQICRKDGKLEMFACSKATKEHESIVTINARPMVVHAGLLRVGAVAGKPVQFQPKYVPAMGPVVDVWVLWKDKDGMNRKVKAQEWVRHVKTGKVMEYDWVFAGSTFWVDEDDEKKTRYYSADAGDVICVSNFPTAMLDIPVASTQDNQELEFEPFTDRIPDKGTKVRLVLIPRLDKKDDGKKDEKKDEPTKVETKKDAVKKNPSKSK